MAPKTSEHVKPQVATSASPRISFIAAPTQRFYVLSFGALLQAMKARSFLLRWWYPEYWWRFLLTWVTVDVLFVLGIPELRIPRLAFGWKARILQVSAFVLLDIVLFKPYDFTPPWSWLRIRSDSEISTREKAVYVEDVINQGGHLFGQHTVRLSPISTAKLNPHAETFCLEPPENVALIPILFNNTRPIQMSYSVSPLGDRGSRIFVNLTSKDLKQIEKARFDNLRALQKSDTEDEYVEDDLYDSDDSPRQRVPGGKSGDPPYQLEKTQTIQHIKVSRPGIVRVEKVLDQSHAEIRIHSVEVTVVQCPKVMFTSRLGDNAKRCAGTSEALDLKVHGVPPLTLRWHRDLSGRREHFMVEGIEGDHDAGRRVLAQELDIPLNLQLDALGRHIYTLDALTDGVGNTFDLTTVSSTRSHTTQVVTVLRRSAMSFASCGPGRPASLLIDKEAPLLISANEADIDDGPWDITIKYQPVLDDKRKFKPWRQDFRTPPGRRDLTLLARAPGEYSILSVNGKFCSGDVLSPESCRVVEQPFPTVDIEWKRIHECSGDTGVSVSLVFHGKPPFKIYYQTKRDRDSPRELSRIFSNSRGEVTLQPETSGSYAYTFLRVNDANYENIKLETPTINQVVHPLASADFVKSTETNGKQVVHSCSGNTVDIDVMLRGTPPWNLDIQILGPKNSEQVRILDLKQYREKLHLPIPSVIDEEGGTFQVDLVSVEDAYGCKRMLSVTGVSVNVRRVKPSVKFYAKDGKRQVTVLEGQAAQLPLRLTGDAPWSVKYRKAYDLQAGIAKVSLSTANELLSASEPGLYELLEVTDAYCPGTVITNEETYLVEWLPRPTVQIASTIQVIYVASNGTFIKPGVCEGTDDYIDLRLQGRPPFQINYNVARDTDNAGIRLIDQPTFSSIQNTTRFQLQTSKRGRVYYEVQAVGDASYPLNNRNVVPQSKRLRFEQEVFPRPLAYFRQNSRMSFCFNNSLIARDEHSVDGTIVLKGTPPFRLHLSIKNLASSEVHKEALELSQHEWKLHMPNYVFRTVGPHLVVIDSVQDASNCPQAEPEPSSQSQWIDVSETAVIVPFDRREDFCVGEALQFQLEGSPPWKVRYRFDGRVISTISSVSPFRRVADRAGVFSIVSIAQERDMCQTTVSDLNFRIHSIPSAKVSHGKTILQNIREGTFSESSAAKAQVPLGDQAEIHFELIGEPPFTFTYQRTELPNNVKRGNAPQVLETHTVSGVTNKEYSIYSAAEGTWTVSFIQDRYCRYPPIQADKGIEQA